jgi:hypothetical protein
MSIQQAEKDIIAIGYIVPQINLALLELDAIKSDLVNTFSKQQWDGQLGQENSWQKSLYPLTDSALPSTNPQYDVFK